MTGALHAHHPFDAHPPNEFFWPAHKFAPCFIVKPVQQGTVKLAQQVMQCSCPRTAIATATGCWPDKGEQLQTGMHRYAGFKGCQMQKGSDSGLARLHEMVFHLCKVKRLMFYTKAIAPALLPVIAGDPLTLSCEGIPQESQIFLQGLNWGWGLTEVCSAAGW